MKELRRIANGRFTIELQLIGTGEPLLYLHGAGGLLGADPFLDALGHHFKVIAPHLPGYGESTGVEHIDDLFDVILMYHQLLDEMGVASAHVVGHSMGGMLAAEFAALDVHRVKKLVLVTPAGFWLDEHPIPDVFAMELPELAAHLFHDPNSAMAQMFTAVPTDMKLLEAMYVERVKRFTQASKFLWPIPDRGLKRRAWRIAAPTLVMMGESDRLIPPIYANEFTSRIRNARAVTMKAAGHMPMYEQPDEFVKTVREFLRS
ncbi:MAG TPA: alpha/beta fold hydrolase [Candidatus Binataceae bacterium]|nr:alpha/beta fold hydrolase [Candidatus Binataceae bacterium]